MMLALTAVTSAAPPLTLVTFDGGSTTGAHKLEDMNDPVMGECD